MDWTPGGMSEDVEDRRSSSGGGGFGGGGLGLGGLVILLVVSLVTGRNYIGAFLSGGHGQASTQSGPANPGAVNQQPAANDRDAQLVSYVLDDAQKTWTQIFAAQNLRYRRAHLVLYRDATYSGCGTARAATGPFYCPNDERIYIDLSFWDDLKRFGGDTGEFAQAYVIAHELGHHVQKLEGIEGRMRQLADQDPDAQNHLSVDLELQADCFAGMWAHSSESRKVADEQDIQGALSAAAAVGDDHLEKMSGRAVSPERWTHGSSAERATWFLRGVQNGTFNACRTFNGNIAP